MTDRPTNPATPPKTYQQRFNEELDDNREDIRQLYDYNFSSPPITEKQLKTIYKLVDEGYLFKRDFPNKKYRRKKNLTRQEACQIIRIGVGRKY